jgi:antibiotic biosynthesis monooxygenase (ABM) superfamily enzyme
MGFIQTVSFSTSRFDDLKALAEEYQQGQSANAPGYRGAKIVKDRDRDDAYMVIAEFESYELAMENSGRPETDAFAKKMAALVEGDMTYGNYDVVEDLGT